MGSNQNQVSNERTGCDNRAFTLSTTYHRSRRDESFIVAPGTLPPKSPFVCTTLHIFTRTAQG